MRQAGAVALAVERARRAGRDLRSTRHTVMRDVFERRSPPPRAFARHDDTSWVVPPCEVLGPESISIGDSVVILEHGSLRVLGAEGASEALLRIGDGVRLGRFLTIVCEIGVELGQRVAGSDCVTIRDTWGDVGVTAGGTGGLPLPEGRPVFIADGAYLGYGSTITPGVRVGEGAFVGEGAVVLEDVEPFTVVYGNPACVVRRYDAGSRRWEGPRWP